jgi:chromosome segregation ATPase
VKRLCILLLILTCCCGAAVASDARHDLERETRALGRLLTDLRLSLAQAEEESAALERAAAAVTPLEPAQREQDIESLQEWYADYTGWLQGSIAGHEADLALLQTGKDPLGRAADGYRQAARTSRELGKELASLEKEFRQEQKRLTRALERRDLLENRLRSLREELAGLGEEQRGKTSRKSEKLKATLTTLQNELLTLPRVDTALLKHYFVLAERCRGTGELLGQQAALFEAVAGSGGIGGRGRKSSERDTEAYQRVLDSIEAQQARLKDRLAGLDRRSARVTPSGTLGEIERSAELLAYYEELRQWVAERLARLELLINDYRLELSAVTPDRHD